MATELQKATRATNWTKLQIKGAIGNLKNAAKTFRVDTYDYNRCMSTLTKLEQLLLKQADKDYLELKKLITKNSSQ